MEDCDEVLDSQFLLENVGFMDSTFDFQLHDSIVVVKDYADQLEPQSTKRKLGSNHSKYVLESTLNNSQLVVPSVDTGRNKFLNAWGLPAEIARKYEQRGIVEMFDWQTDCLSNPKVLLDCSNLVYSAPTSAGKTLVAEIITIKTVLERQKKVIIILPFVSIVREKMFYLQDILSSSGVRVEGFMGSQSPPGGLQSVHIAICTIEKANSLINKMLDEGNISDLGAVVVDELHLLGDPHRGYILELLLTKVKYVSSKLENVQIQIVGMSATLPNLQVLADWLRAELFVTDFRPIPLDEYCLVGKTLYDKDGKVATNIDDKSLSPFGSDHVLKICMETIQEGCSILIFCMTKNRCESLAQNLSSAFYKLGCSGNEMGKILREQLKSESIVEVLEQLKNCPVGLDQVLKNIISFGVAYHHAGLTFDERDIIEGAFKNGAIRVLVATSTLSSGVNLPARKVVIRTPVFLKEPINILTYKQMIGRAGRMGKDTKGESILICTEAEKKIGLDLMMGALQPVKSCIESDDKLMRTVLEMIASEIVGTLEELELYSNCTLLSAQQEVPISLLQSTLEKLINYELIKLQKESKVYTATSLGKACLSSSMAPNDGLSLFVELQKARQCLVLETDLHLIYLVTPYSVSNQWADIDWLHLLTLWESLTKAMKRVGELVGVQESFIVRCVRGSNKMGNPQNKVNIHKRFYTALALQDLVNEVPLSEVAVKFQCARGFLQSLQQAAATFAGMVTVFSHQLGWKNMEILISQFQDRLHFGIQSELLDLMKLPSLNGLRARALYDAGFETIASIASADVNLIEKALIKAVPFQSEKQGEDDDCVDIRKRNKIKNVWITGHCGITTQEAAEKLNLEARKLLQCELGVVNIEWDKATQIQPQSNLSLSIAEINQPLQLEEHLEQEMNENNLAVSGNGHESGIILEDVYESTVKEHLVTANSSSHENEEINGNPPEADNSLKELQIENVMQCNEVTCSLKDDFIWDTLNFTESALSNITKTRLSNKIFSPEITFTDSEISFEANKEKSTPNSTLCVTNKDVSLFSSDGEQNSLFEDSLPLDLIPSRLLNDESVNSSTKESNLFKNQVVDSNLIIKPVQSKILDIDEDEDIKLVYDPDTRPSTIERNSSPISIQNSPVNSITITTEVKASLKRNKANLSDSDSKSDVDQPVNKKTKVENNINDLIPSLKSKNSKVHKTKFKTQIIKCYVLRDIDIIGNVSLISKLQISAVYINLESETKNMQNEIIGAHIYGLKPEYPKGANEDSKIKGFALFFGTYILYIDLSTVDDKSNIISNLCDNVKLRLLSLKSCYKYFFEYFGVEIKQAFDVSLAEWLLHSEERESDICGLAKRYCDGDLKMMNTKTSLEEICLKAWVIWMVAEKQEKSLLTQYTDLKRVLDVETEVSRILAKCECTGVNVDKQLASRMLVDVKNSQEVIQKHAFRLCGRHFNFNSSKDVAKILGIYRGRRVSTKKSVLSTYNTPISTTIMYWRKLNSILTKTLYPLTERALIYTEDNRITPSYTMFTCSGRISMHEPNLQNVPRTFTIPVSYLEENTYSDDIVEFNCRNIFKAAPGCVLVSADYCQLEMRILTHYCEDPVLLDIMRSETDVFKSIAASWGGVEECEVDDDLRQRAKQLCYGIIYGMGNRTLSQSLDVTEIEAAAFMETFHKTYPSIRIFTDKICDDCRVKGYIETLMGRRRYLPDINSRILAKKRTAERQAINTTIQGSAADIAKSAMCGIQQKISPISEENRPKLILQMHDELIYEVPEMYKDYFVRILKEVMENTVMLQVPLPVKVKTGYSWGSLSEIKL